MLLMFAAVGLILAYLLHRLVECRNSLSWTDLVATNGVLNAYKIAFWIGVLASTWVIVNQTYTGKLDASMMAVYLAFLGGVPVGMSAIGSRTVQPSYRNPPPPDLPTVPEPEQRDEDPLLDDQPKRRRSLDD